MSRCPASQSASRRADQCVRPRSRSACGGGVTVAASTSAVTSGVITVTGPPGRGASCSPAMPDSAYRRRQVITVGSVQPTRSAICGPVNPCSASNTIRARCATRAGSAFDRARRSSSVRS
jgi:hypothetical protein